MNMIDPLVSDILERSMVARIATVSKNGRPHVNPLYFVIADGHIRLGTATYTLAAHNVGANPAVQILFEIESMPHDRRILRIDGTASVVTDERILAHYRRGVTRKYIVTPGGLWNMVTHPRQWGPMRRHLRGGAACVLDVEPSTAGLVADPDPDPGADPDAGVGDRGGAADDG